MGRSRLGQRIFDKGLQERVTLRLPLIPEYNTEADIDESEQCLREMGFTLFDRFEYLTPEAIGPHALKKRHDAAKAPKNPSKTTIMTNNRITELFGIKYPVIQGGMVWISGWRLASAVSNAGGLGLLGAGSMHPETLVEHIHKMREATDKPWGVNVPLMYPEIDRLIDLLIEEKVGIVFTSAGSPKKYTQRLHDAGMKVVHVVSSSKFARKCEEAGVDDHHTHADTPGEEGHVAAVDSRRWHRFGPGHACRHGPWC